MATQEKVTVRGATTDDAEALRAFPDADKVDETLAAAAADEAAWAVVDVDDEIVASAVLDLVSELRPEVKRIWVERDQRRQGFGSMVTRWLEDRARELGHDACYMAIDPDNEKAISMAIDLSYSATGDHLFVEHPDEVHGDQTAEDSDAAEGGYYAIYRKSLTMR